MDMNKINDNEVTSVGLVDDKIPRSKKHKNSVIVQNNKYNEPDFNDGI